MNLSHEGWLIKDAETKYTSTGKPVVSFSMPVKQGKKEDNKPDIWFNFKAVGAAAEILQSAKKGNKVSIVRAIPDEWTDKNGNKRLSWTIFEAELEIDSAPKKTTPKQAPKPQEEPLPPWNDDDIPY